MFHHPNKPLWIGFMLLLLATNYVRFARNNDADKVIHALERKSARDFRRDVWKLWAFVVASNVLTVGIAALHGVAKT